MTTKCQSGNFRQIFGSWFSDVKGVKKGNLHVRANGDCPVSCDDTHAVVTRPEWAPEHGLHTECGPLRRWVANLAHRQVLEQGRGQR